MLVDYFLNCQKKKLKKNTNKMTNLINLNLKENIFKY